MYRYLRLFSVLSLALFFSFCSKSNTDRPPVIIPSDGYNEYTQYGTPFASIPKAEDIIMYEVNLRAMSLTGDLNGVINKLDHISSLGVNVLWLMPIHPIGEINSVNSPYSIRDFMEVSSEYGSLNDLRKLTDEAHKRGISVIMDWVANHTSWDNSWMENKDWYTQNSSGEIIHPPGTNWLDVADLNFSNEEMRLAMIDAMKYWIYEANIDGYRCDYADGVPYDFWKQAIDTLILTPERDFIFLAEGDRNNHFNAGFDLTFAWNSYSTIKEVFNGQSINKIFTSHNNEYTNIPDGKHKLRFTTNHDESAWDASPIVLFDGVMGATAATVINTFVGGVPLLYTGQEVGVATTTSFFDNSTIDWDANPDMLLSYNRIMNFYSQSDCSRSGINTIYSHNDIMCLRKTLDNKEVIIIVNVRNQSISYSLPESLQNTIWYNAMSDTTLELDTQIDLSGYDYLILSNDLSF